MGYEYMDVSGDAGVRAEGASLGEAFADAAVGMYGLMVNIEGVAGAEGMRVEVLGDKGRGPGALLVAWLNELIYIFETRGFVGQSVRVDDLSGGRVVSTVTGEVFDAARHEGRLLLKAATYHGLIVEERGGRWVVEVVFDA